MQFKTLFLLAASVVATMAVALPEANADTKAAAAAKLFTRDSELVKRDPCLSPCYDSCQFQNGCGLQCWICCEIKNYEANACR